MLIVRCGYKVKQIFDNRSELNVLMRNADKRVIGEVCACKSFKSYIIDSATIRDDEGRSGRLRINTEKIAERIIEDVCRNIHGRPQPVRCGQFECVHFLWRENVIYGGKSQIHSVLGSNGSAECAGHSGGCHGLYYRFPVWCNYERYARAVQIRTCNRRRFNPFITKSEKKRIPFA